MENTFNITSPAPLTELIIREGAALPVHDPKKIVLSGDINSVSAFLKSRETGHSLQKVDKNRAIVIVDRAAMTILLMLDPEDTFGTEIKGSLEFSDELKVFHINQNKTFTRDELVKIIRFNKLAFDNSDKHAELLKAYQAFEASAKTDLQQGSDTRGNKANSFAKAVTTNIPTEFILLIPVFKGKSPYRFRVEICLDVTDGGARFWFESVELNELIQTSRDIIINEELRNCEGFVIINK